MLFRSVVALEHLEGGLAEIAAVRLLAVQHHHRALDLTRVGEKFRVDEREEGRLVPAAVRIE